MKNTKKKGYIDIPSTTEVEADQSITRLNSGNPEKVRYALKEGQKFGVVRIIEGEIRTNVILLPKTPIDTQYEVCSGGICELNLDQLEVIEVVDEAAEQLASDGWNFIPFGIKETYDFAIIRTQKKNGKEVIFILVPSNMK